MAEDAAARFVEDEIAQGAVIGDEARLLPQGFAGRGRDAADDHVADLALGVAGDDVDDLGGAHGEHFHLRRCGARFLGDVSYACQKADAFIHALVRTI